MEFSQFLSQIAIRHLRVEIKLKQPLNAPTFIGSTIHGSAGWALRSVAPHLWPLAYGDSQVKYMRFSNLPDISHKLAKDDCISFDWWLYGPMAEQSDYILPMLKAWGKQGILDCEFELQKLAQIDALERQTLLYVAPLGDYSQPINIPASNLLQCLEMMAHHFDNIAHNYSEQLTCVITANSTLMIKHQKQICQQAVDINTLLSNIARRVISLGKTINNTPYPVHDFLPTICAQLISDQTKGQSHIRKKQQQHNQLMTGISGYWIYQGDLHDALPWLTIGQWLGIGNKTSFGFGDYQWQILAC